MARKKLIRFTLRPDSPLSLIQVTIILLEETAVYFTRAGRGDIGREVLGCTYAIKKGWQDVHRF